MKITAIAAMSVCAFVIVRAGTAVLTLSAVLALVTVPMFFFFVRYSAAAGNASSTSTAAVGLVGTSRTPAPK